MNSIVKFINIYSFSLDIGVYYLYNHGLILILKLASIKNIKSMKNTYRNT